MSKENTDMVAQMDTTMVAQPDVQATINLPALTNREEVAEVMAANLEGMEGQFQFDKVKIPSGGGISFEVVDESGEPNPVKELVGVVLDHYPIKSWWADEYSGEKNAPDCSSMDCKTGTGNPEHGIKVGQACATCPHNQWGSDPKGGKGKACKDIFRVYILPEGYAFPVLLALPPTSISNWRKYIQRLTSRIMPYYGVVSLAKLEKDKNAGGIEYSKVVFAKAADLTPVETKTMKDYADSLRPAMRAQAIDSTEYNVESVDYSPDEDEEEGY